MAKSPVEVYQRLEATWAQELRDFEEVIDSLLDQYNGDLKKRVEIPLLKVPSALAKKAICNAYLSAGWDSATFKSDQGEGETFSLTWTPPICGCQHLDCPKH